MNREAMNYPFRSLGFRLKKTRQKFQESLAEVSGAVEIDTNLLLDIEAGKLCPSEDILLLLIRHFSLNEDEASKLWQLADYDEQDDNDSFLQSERDRQPMSVPMDLRILYTDLVHVMVSDYGVVINFMQNSPPGSQNLLISRVGMSKKHAKTLLKVLQDTLSESEKIKPDKLLPGNNNYSDSPPTN